MQTIFLVIWADLSKTVLSLIGKVLKSRILFVYVCKLDMAKGTLHWKRGNVHKNHYCTVSMCNASFCVLL